MKKVYKINNIQVGDLVLLSDRQIRNFDIEIDIVKNKRLGLVTQIFDRIRNESTSGSYHPWYLVQWFSPGHFRFKQIHAYDELINIDGYEI
jgi:hypothetical protein